MRSVGDWFGLISLSVQSFPNYIKTRLREIINLKQNKNIDKSTDSNLTYAYVDENTNDDYIMIYAEHKIPYLFD